eukprot:RCo041349
MAEEPEVIDDDQQAVSRKKKKKDRPERKLKMRVTNMEEEMRVNCVEFAQQALDEHKLHKDVAAYIKRLMDETYAGTWHCIVGVHFGGNVSHDANSMINFFLDKLGFLVFRSGPPEQVQDEGGGAPTKSQ